MSRERGLSTLATTIEVLVSGPLDARAVVSTHADLTNPDVWLARDKSEYTYIGMLTAVISDPDITKNGIYWLSNTPLTDISNWIHLSKDIDASMLENLVTKEELESLANRVSTLESIDTSTFVTNDDLLEMLALKADNTKVNDLATRVDALESATIPFATPDTVGGLTYTVEDNILSLNFIPN